MKKIFALALCAVMLFTCAFSLVSCSETEYVAVDATDLLKEDFGIAVKKGNDTLKTAINNVVDEWVANGTMTKYVDYYTALSDYEAGVEGAAAPVAGDLKVSWDFGSATETITVYTESGFAPFEFMSGGNVIGVDIAIMNEVAVRMGKKIEVKDVDFNTIVANVQNSTGDAVGAAGLTITEERMDSVDFSSIYYSSTLVVVSDKDKSISSVKDLAGLTVGVQEGTSGDLIASRADSDAGYKYLDEDEKEVTVKSDINEIKRYKQYSLAFADLKAGRIDAILMDKLPALTMLSLAN